MIRLPMLAGPEKPREHEPCNGCGYCCDKFVCPVGQIAYRTAEAPCPGLTWRDGRALCGVVLAVSLEGGNAAYRRAALVIGIGSGCDSKEPIGPDGTRAR
jgi:Fe-S-cluster-containing hydrogenase component 2